MWGLFLCVQSVRVRWKGASSRLSETAARKAFVPQRPPLRYRAGGFVFDFLAPSSSRMPLALADPGRNSDDLVQPNATDRGDIYMKLHFAHDRCRDLCPSVGASPVWKLVGSSAVRAWVALALILLLLFGCGQVSLNEDDYRERAAQFEATGDLRSAAIEWKNVLQKNPDDAEARLRLGLLSIILGDLTTARVELRRAADLGADPRRVRPALARIWLMDGEFARVTEELRPEDFSDMEATSQAQVHNIRGEAFAALGRFAEALASFESALQLVPELALAHVGIAGVAMSEGRGDDALGHLETALSIAPGLYQGWNLLGDLERSEGQLAAAEEAYSRAIATSPTPISLHLKRALTRLALEDISGVQEDLHAMRGLGPTHPGHSYVQGLVYYRDGRNTEAQSAFEEALSRSPDFHPALFFLGASQAGQQQWHQAELSLRRFLRTHPDSQEALRLLAQVRVQMGDLDAAATLLRQALALNPDDVLSLNMMGNIYLTRGEHDEAIAHLRRLTTIRPDDPSARATLASAMLLGDDEALGDLAGAIERASRQPGPDARDILNLIQAGQFDSALAAATRLTELSPEDPTAYNLQAAAYTGLGEIEPARESLQQALRLSPGEPSATSNLARIALQHGEVEEARRLWRASLQRYPGHVGVTLGLAQLEAAQGNPDTARSLLEQAVTHHPEALPPRLLLANDSLAQGDPQRAIDLLQPVRQANQGDTRLLDVLARAQIAAGQHARAIETLKELAEEMAQSAEGLARLGVAFEDAGAPAQARASYAQALEIEPSQALALQRLAILELREGRLSDAMALARRMQREETTAAAGHALEGRVHQAAQRTEDASDAYSQAYALRPSGEIAALLGRILTELGRPAEAADILRARLADHPDETMVRSQLALALMAANEDQAAIREYEILLETLPDNAVVLNNLAFLYQSSGNPQALELSERAYALLPENAAIADTLGWILINRGDLDGGLPLVERARQELPERSDVRYHYAAGLAKSGRFVEARQELVTLLDDFGSFPQREEAEALLQSLP